METILSLISFDSITSHPTHVWVTGLVVTAYLLFRALTSVFRLRLVKAISSLFYATVILVVLSQFGAVSSGLEKLNEPEKSRSEEQ